MYIWSVHSQRLIFNPMCQTERRTINVSWGSKIFGTYFKSLNLAFRNLDASSLVGSFFAHNPPQDPEEVTRINNVKALSR